MISERLIQLQENYELDLNKIVKDIKESKAKSVLFQFPDGLKNHATDFIEFFSQELPKVEFRIFLGSCYGACDVPNTDCDLIIQFGHSKWE